MMIEDHFSVFGDWFYIHFTENNGMAFGITWGGKWGKLFLSLFRIAAVGGIFYYLTTLVKKKAPSGLIISIALIFAGAVGNIIDSAFYGVIFTDSFHRVATFMPDEGGYATFLHGKVVDMLYFPLMEGTFPDWVPGWGGERFLFFRPIFNVADSSISIGVFMILLFQKRYFPQEKKVKVDEEKENAEVVSTAAQ